MKLETQTKILLDSVNNAGRPPVETIPLAVLRSGKGFFGYESHALVKKIENITIVGQVGEIPLRIYIPQGDGPFPVFVMLHGGGWTIGSVNTCDGKARELCNQVSCIVVSVDYHLAPEHKFPIPLLDCYTATEWVIKNIARYEGDPGNVAIGGDSAGGNLAAAVTLMAQDKKSFSLVAQVLAYPATNYDFSSESYNAYKEGYVLTLSAMKYFWGCYTNNKKEANDPYVSPLRAASCKNLPKALIIVAEFDPLRDDGLQYGEKLSLEGVPVQTTVYPTIHGFTLLADRLSIGKTATEEIAAFLRTVFSEKNKLT